MRLRSCRHLLLLTLGCAPIVVRAQEPVAPEALDVSTAVPLDALVTRLATKLVVFVGETHDRYDHHLNQLAIITRLHQLDPQLVIGVEYFQQPFQSQVDDYIAGRTDEAEFLRSTDYYQGWGFDYRLYAPIFRFAREQRIPVRALNVPSELASAVAKVGIAGLSEKQRAYLPKEIDRSDEAYKDRLREIFEEHGPAKPEAFDHFVEAQLVWDEGMAESAAAYLTANPGRRMVILVGSGHVEFGSGIPKRLERRTKASYAIVINSGEEAQPPRVADYLLFGKKQELPAAGTLGVSLEDKDGKCRVRSLVPGGAAEKSGLKAGDVLVKIDGQMVARTADLRLALWQKKPGDRVEVSVLRKRGSKDSTQEFEVELKAPAKPTGPGR